MSSGSSTDSRSCSKSGIGSGENLAFLPPDWTVHGVDIARTQLEACLRRHPAMAGRLAWAEAENLPFADATFDACWSVGGFNYFSDHEAALREMRRVTRPGGPVVVADEVPGPPSRRARATCSASRPSMPGGCASWASTANSWTWSSHSTSISTALRQPCLARGDATPDLARAGLLSCQSFHFI